MKGAVKTTCPYCGVGCGILAIPRPEGGLDIAGDPDHPANFGKLCSKGSALGETVGLEDRLLVPAINDKPVDWNTALDTVADRFTKTIAQYGPDSVAFYVSGQLLTEDYYVANKLMKGFIGSANIDTNSRLCMASSVAGHKRAFGSDTVPGCYEDLELADLVVLVGSNLAWCHPVIYQRLAEARAARPHMKVVVIDPRRTATCDIADLHLPIASDGDTALFNGLLAHLAQNKRLDKDFIDNHTQGFEHALAQAREETRGDANTLQQHTGLSAEQIARFFTLFANTEKTVTVYSQGVNQSTGGSDKVNAIINCHLATGRIGKPGMGPFSITGQPNAMGGREVGGLANMLAAHMNIEDEAHRRITATFWDAPNIATKPGLKAVQMFDAVAAGHIKAIWIMATNPVVSLPQARQVEAALAACPFVVVSDVVANTDTLRHAHVKLPSLAWAEKSGTVTNSERRISRQRTVLPPPGEAKADWWQLSQVALRMGFQGFHYDAPADIFREHAALSDYENDGTRDFTIGALSSLSKAGYDALQPVQWPHSGEQPPQARLFASGQFFTPNGRANFVATSLPEVQQASPLLHLNTGRVRDHWHTMTRTGLSPRNSAHIAEPFCELHPADAMRLGIRDADLVRLSNGLGSVTLRALIKPHHRPGDVFVPIHWNDQWASSARVDRLVEANCDPVSGQPGLKTGRVCVEKQNVFRHGFMVSREKPATEGLAYWALARCSGGWRLEFALDEARPLPCAGDADTRYVDAASGEERLLWFDGPQLQRLVMLSPGPVGASRTWAAEQLGIIHGDAAQRMVLAAGRPPLDQPDRGAIVCSCFGIGHNQISALALGGCRSVAAIGQACNAGTNCGSCKSEISQILNGTDHEDTVIAAE